MEKLRHQQEKETEIRHNCALFGIVLTRADETIFNLVAAGIDAQQHRGQQAAGISWINERVGGIRSLRGLGLRNRAIDGDKLSTIPPARVAIGHTRYSTVNDKQRNNETKNEKYQRLLRSAQPFDFHNFAVAQNGTAYPNNAALNGESYSDTYRVGEIISESLISSGLEDFEKSVIETLFSLESSAYTFIFAHKNGTLYVARDAAGFRPCKVGRFVSGDNFGLVIASETVGFNAIKSGERSIDYMGNIPRGIFARIDADGIKYIWEDPRVEHVQRAECFFEEAYFADAASESQEGTTNHIKRADLGRRLAQRVGPIGDYVVPIPNSGWSYAEGVHHETGIELAQAIQTNRYIGRTFIGETEQERKAQAKEKYRFIPELINGKKLIVVDDSLVRGNTTSGLIRLLLEDYCAESVHVLIGIPPITDPCCWGIDFPTHNELIYNRLMDDGSKSTHEYEARLARWLVDNRPDLLNRVKVSFQRLDDCKDLLGKNDHCFHCVSGEVPLGLTIPIKITSP